MTLESMGIHIRKLDDIDPHEPEVLNELLVAVAEFNGDVGRDLELGRLQLEDRRLGEKLKAWLDKLVSKVREIVKSLSDVASFSITVGAPLPVSISVTFSRSQAE